MIHFLNLFVFYEITKENQDVLCQKFEFIAENEIGWRAAFVESSAINSQTQN